MPSSEVVSSYVVESDSASITYAASSTEHEISSSTVAETSTYSFEPSSTIASSSINDDSPPYTPPAGALPTPENPIDFIENYTYQDDPLPVPIAMGFPPTTDGIPFEPELVKTCMITPSRSDATFELLSADERVPLVKTADGTLGLPKKPSSEEEYRAMGPVEDIKFANFSFIASDNGMFDLVLNDSPRQYVAKKADGTVVLTSSSTGATDDTLATSIFDVTCEGRLLIRIGTQYYTWAISDKDSKMQTTNGTPETLYTLPDDPVPSQRQRRSKSQEGNAPRCGPAPRDLEAREFPGRRDTNPNQCGSSSFNVPDLTFGRCCDQHDNDFDTCSMTFEEGNNNFHSCMRGSGCAQFDHWYSWWLLLGCRKTAAFYYSVVSAYPGRKAFYDATRERCKCYCPSNTPDMCSIGGNVDCRSVYTNDMNNCGACGRTCPPGSRCNRGRCVCPVDLCGDRCVTLSSHPKNCGQCGRISPSGYCFNGQPYTPPAVCTRDNGFRNGNFAKGADTWSVVDTATGQATALKLNVTAVSSNVAAVEDADGNAGVIRLNTFAAGQSLRTVFKMCPGSAYSIGFQLQSLGTSACTYEVFVAGDRLTGGNTPIGNRWVWVQGLRVGPFSTPRNGLTVAGPELLVEFELRFQCSLASWFIKSTNLAVDQFSAVPI
ncbi:hypothetical protein NX059_008185 [Plenodomus lindquistii]|nr:hypothetical protein NX059_008185 [Plenodomus lindquistii]